MSVEYLFQDGDLRSHLKSIENSIYYDIERKDPDYILNVAVNDYVSYLFEKNKLEVPKLKREKIYIEQNETDIDVRYDFLRDIRDKSKPFYLKGNAITYHVPFDGSSILFNLKPGGFIPSLPRAKVRGNELLITVRTLQHNSEEIKAEFETQFSLIHTWLEMVYNDVSIFYNELKQRIKSKVEWRREKLLNDRNLVANLGFPLKKLEDKPETFTVPEIRRKIIIEKPKASTKPFAPEPALDLKNYEGILEIISNMSLVFERSPSTFKTMEEEDFRNHFLVQLNGQFKGNATGETFNSSGKTDILIRVEDKNIFIAECAFWRGKAYFQKKIDQLLGYACWRDTKTAIILFNKTKELSNVLKQFPDIVKEHSNFKRTVEDYQNETGFRFILHHNDDKNRELILTVLVFEVPV